MLSLQINLSAIKNNIAIIKRKLPAGVKFCLVVKSDAYGHGLIPVSQAAEHQVDYLAVFNIDEGWKLRQAGVKKPILVLGVVQTQEIRATIDHQLTISVGNLLEARQFSAAAIRCGRPAVIHLSIDTGLHREGFLASNESAREQTAAEIKEVLDLPGLHCEGIWSHLATAVDYNYSQFQLGNFNNLLFLLQRHNLDFPLRHLAASQAVFLHPKSYFDMVRCGAGAYGLLGDLGQDAPKNLQEEINGLQPAITFSAPVVAVKTVPAKSRIGYFGDFVTNRLSHLAIVPVGYADGLWWGLSGKMAVLLFGRRCPVVGKISMNQIIIDVSLLSVEQRTNLIGQEAILLGASGNDIIKSQDWAKELKTNNREIVTRLPATIKREYI